MTDSEPSRPSWTTVEIARNVMIGPLLKGSNKWGVSFHASDPALPLHHFHLPTMKDVAKRISYAPKAVPQHTVPGTTVYGGPLYLHFAHFIADSIHRLWARQLIPSLHGAPVAFQTGANLKSRLPSWAIQVFSLLDLAPEDIVLVNQDTRFEMLAMPPQARIMNGKTLMPGYAKLFPFNAAPLPAIANAARRIYVTRSRHRYTGCYLGESYIEKTLSAAGFEIVFPEDHPIAEMISILRHAEVIVFAEGGALQLLQLSGPLAAAVFVIGRRRGAMGRFADIVDCVSPRWRVFDDVVDGVVFEPQPRKDAVGNSKAGNFLNLRNLVASLSDFIGQDLGTPADADLRQAMRLDLIDFLLDPRFPERSLTPEIVGAQILHLRAKAKEIGLVD